MSKVTIPLGVDPNITFTEETLRKMVAKSNTEGYLAEFGAPRIPQDSTTASRTDRLRTIVAKLVCAKITNIRMAEDGVTIIGDVEPHGPMSKVVKQAIEGNSVENLGFSVRGIYRTSKNEIVTYDLVKF